MGHNAEGRESDWEAIDEAEKDLDSYNAIYKACEKSLCKDCVFLNKFGEVVES